MNDATGRAVMAVVVVGTAMADTTKLSVTMAEIVNPMAETSVFGTADSANPVTEILVTVVGMEDISRQSGRRIESNNIDTRALRGVRV